MKQFLMSVIFLFCFFTVASSQYKYEKIKFAKLSKQGVEVFSNLAKILPEIKVDGKKLMANEGYKLWATVNKRIIVAPESTDSPAYAFTTSWEKNKYRIPGGGILTSVCWCESEDKPMPGDDCKFENDKSGDPTMAECNGSCGCNRSNSFGPSVGGTILIRSVEHY